MAYGQGMAEARHGSATSEGLHREFSNTRAANDLTRQLRAWGDFQENAALTSGYPTTNVLAKMARTGIVEPFRPGHRVLAREMPASVRKVQHAYMGLPLVYQRVLWVKFVLDRDDKGRPYTDDTRAALIDLHSGAFRVLLRQARKAIRVNLG